MRRLFTLIPTLTLALALAVPLLAHAQADNKVSREREALRRAQAALHEAQQQRDALQAERGPLLEKAKADAEAALAPQRRATATAQAEVRQLREALAKLQAEQAAERQAAQQAATAATQAAQDNTRRDQAQRAQIDQLRNESDERRQANATLSKLLEQRSKALADAQRRVGELHAAGMEALTLYRDKDRLTGALQDDPVLGLTGVRVENRVQALRQRLDGLQQPAPSAE
ncbi:MAG: hypothetical protein CFE45_05095 [Burkholderiales bacterium PBB5]|nr:MAG: hypothetical protein CFE45_05095 [Burkholderiales bacterium PBB5]